jgi:hypothetical protein
LFTSKVVETLMTERVKVLVSRIKAVEVVMEKALIKDGGGACTLVAVVVAGRVHSGCGGCGGCDSRCALGGAG